MNTRSASVIENSLGAFKYVLAVFVMYIGVMTAIGPLQPLDGALGVIYRSREFLVFFGGLVFFSGAALLYGKIRRNRHWVGNGLLSMWVLGVFATVLHTIAEGAPQWYGMTFSVVAGALFLRWRYKTEYVNPNHFVRDMERSQV